MDSFFSNSPISQQQFNIFHRVDRQLYSRLVFDLSRDPAQSYQVMALWLWLEKALQYENRCACFDLITKSLLPLPDALLNALAKESVLVLNCVEKESFPYSSSDTANSSSKRTTTAPPAPAIPMFRILIKSNSSLDLFYGIRLKVISGVTEMANKVCSRAFKDIMKIATKKKAAKNIAMCEAARAGGLWEYNSPMNIVRALFDTAMSLSTPPSVGVSSVQQSDNVSGAPQPRWGFSPLRPNTSTHNIRAAAVDHGKLPNHGLGGDQLSQFMRALALNDQKEKGVADDDQVVPPDERTLFLTFSRGYPIPKNLVKRFFESKLRAPLVEGLYMQEVRSSGQQSLFARLVLRSVSAMEEILEGKKKVKFYIAGKHVWARKYVRKSNQSRSSFEAA